MKLGLLGGTFDPIHRGHLELAKKALTEGGLDRIVLMPARPSPRKQMQQMASAEDRLAMVRLAVADWLAEEPAFQGRVAVSDWELKQPAFTYTIDTLRSLKTDDCSVFLVLGGDSYQNLPNWKCGPEILKEFPVLHYDREDVSPASSSGFRAGEGKSSQWLFPSVEAYIREHGVYAMKVTPEEQQILDRLTKKRRIHTLGVLEYGLTLCKRWGADESKFRTAAVFHDLYRGIPVETIDQMVREAGLPETLLGNPALAHGPLAALAMERDFGISDKEILDAVRWHTTGRRAMTLLDKILFAADAAEPGRAYPGVETLRRLAMTDLDEACAFSIEGTRALVEQQGGWFAPESAEALRDLTKNEPTR